MWLSKSDLKTGKFKTLHGKVVKGSLSISRSTFCIRRAHIVEYSFQGSASRLGNQRDNAARHAPKLNAFTKCPRSEDYCMFRMQRGSRDRKVVVWDVGLYNWPDFDLVRGSPETGQPHPVRADRFANAKRAMFKHSDFFRRGRGKDEFADVGGLMSQIRQKELSKFGVRNKDDRLLSFVQHTINRQRPVDKACRQAILWFEVNVHLQPP